MMQNTQPSRRDVLFGLGATLGTVALNALVQADDATARQRPQTAKPGHVRTPATACIFLTMGGGPSHIDTFDPKPKLRQLHLQEFQRDDKFASAMASGKRYYVESPFRFRKAGAAGADLCEHWQCLADVSDDICFYRGLQAESIDHPTAMYHMNTGNRFGGDPAIGAWTTYGLGSLNQNLPGFIVLPEIASPQGGAANWSNGFLPADFQGTTLRPRGTPILDLNPPPGVTREAQRKNLDLLARLNRDHAERHPHHAELAARIENYELAFRMQTQVPELIDLSHETQQTQVAYGIDGGLSDDFGRRCLLARRLVERGVRFVQLYSEGWDSHDYIEDAHSRRIQAVDRPIAALIADLKQRGLLDSTLIVWMGEFGRSPDNGVRGGVKYGRDHNAKAMHVWLAGGGVNAGSIVGATDELGNEAVEVVHPLRDLHVTLLRLLGLDDNKLTYFHGGRFKQLSQTGGDAIRELIA